MMIYPTNGAFVFFFLPDTMHKFKIIKFTNNNTINIFLKQKQKAKRLVKRVPTSKSLKWFLRVNLPKSEAFTHSPDKQSYDSS